MEVIGRRHVVITLLMISVWGSASTTSGQDPHNETKPRQGSVSDFLGQLGALASQGTAVNGPGGYIQGVLQQYYQNQQLQGRPPYRPYPQRPLPYPADNLQNLQYQQQNLQYQQQNLQNQQNTVLGQTPGGGFGLQPGVRPGPRPGANPGNLQYPQFYQGFRPPLAPSQSFTGALQSVARYDDARCVPRLLCEVTAGGRPGSSRETALPFVNRDTLLSLLTVLNFGSDSPLLVFGRAALLGYMAQGDPATCLSAYPTCPRDPDLLVDYLNNHNGGFFRFFNPGSVNQNFYQQQQYLQQQYLQKLQQQQYLQNQVGQYYAPNFRDNNHYAAGKQQAAQSRILINVHPSENPGSFTSQAFFPNQHNAGSSSTSSGNAGSSYNYGPSPSFFSDAGSSGNQGTSSSFFSNADSSNDQGTSSAIFSSTGSGIRAGRKYNFKFPSKQQSVGTVTKTTAFKFGGEDESRTEPPPGAPQEFFFQGEGINQQLLEPTDNGELPTFTLEDGEYTFVNPYTQTTNKNGDMVKTFSFPHIRVGSPEELSQTDNRKPAYVPLFQEKPATPMHFPDKTGTGDLRLDFDQSFLSPSGNPYGNPAPPVYSVSSSEYQQNRPQSQGTRGGHRLRFPNHEEDRRYT